MSDGAGYREGVEPAWLAVPALGLAMAAELWVGRCLLAYRPLGIRLRRRRTTADPARPRLPVEQIAAEARRLAPVVHHPPRGMSFAKFEGRRHHYDRLLAAACDALEVEHLLDVLEPGVELDRERDRVQTRLWLLGLRIDEVA